MISVQDILRSAVARNPTGAASAVTAVMGDDWAALDLGRPRAHREVQGFVTAALQRAQKGGRSASASALSGRPQAVVKFIRGGGTSDLRGLRTQAAYLGRDGEVKLRRPEDLFGVEATADDLERDWGVPQDAGGGADLTSHFLVSFPSDSDPAAAERAGRAWADEVLGSGRFGDCWDYYTAFHTDRAHPHMHVVAWRRGLDEGRWLKVSRRSGFDFDVLREILVDVSAPEGIELDASPRLARGLHDLPVPDAEIRRADREGRDVRVPSHTAFTACRAAAGVLAFSRKYAADAAVIERDMPVMAADLRRVSGLLERGEGLSGGRVIYSDRELETMDRSIAETWLATAVAHATDPRERDRLDAIWVRVVEDRLAGRERLNDRDDGLDL